MNITKYIPNTITCGNLLCGCVAITMAFKCCQSVGALAGWQWCAIFIGLAAVFDFCDGLCARALKAYSEIGKELDSLCDLVSFGVAPGLLIFNIIDHHTPACWCAWAALLIPVCGALRLARFNVCQAGSTTFTGLPIPAGAIFWVGLAGWIFQYSMLPPTVMLPLIALMSLAMVSNIPMFSLKFKNLSLKENFRRYVIIFAAIGFCAANGVAGLAWTIFLYIIISLCGRQNFNN